MLRASEAQLAQQEADRAIQRTRQRRLLAAAGLPVPPSPPRVSLGVAAAEPGLPRAPQVPPMTPMALYPQQYFQGKGCLFQIQMEQGGVGDSVPGSPCLS